MAKLRLAYGRKNAINSSIRKGSVPKGTLLLTTDSSEILFYDHEGYLRKYEEKYKFTSKLEAENWVAQNDCKGQIFSVHEGDVCNLYIVGYDNKLRNISEYAVQADYSIEDPDNPAYIKNKPSSFSMDMIEGLLEALNSKVSIVNDVRPGVLMTADDSGNLQCSGIPLTKLMTTIEKKVELSDEVVKPGYLTVVDESGNLRSTNVQESDIVKTCDVVLGSITYSKKIDVSGEYLIEIPQEVRTYASLNVYQNGKLLAEGIHYVVSGDNIVLRSYTTYAGDIFSFVGHGCTTNVPGSDSHHIHLNKDILDSITQDRINLWDNTVTIFKVNGVQIPVEHGTISFFVPTKAEDIEAASIHHEHEDYIKKESIFDEEGIILPTLLPKADENVIEAIMLGNNTLPVIDKVVVIPVATTESFGVVRSADDFNKVFIDTEGIMSIKKLDLSKLTLANPDGELTLAGGDSTPRI